MGDRYGGAYIDSLGPYVMGPIGGELQQQLTVVGALSQAEQTMTATGTVPVAPAAQGGRRSWKYLPLPMHDPWLVPAVRGMADLLQPEQRLQASALMRWSERVELWSPGAKTPRFVVVEGVTCQDDLEEAADLLDLVEVLEGIDVLDRKELVLCK